MAGMRRGSIWPRWRRCCPRQTTLSREVSVILDHRLNYTLTAILVKAPSEAIFDSHLLLNIAAQVSQKAKSLKHDAGGFDDTDFVAQLVTFLGGRRADAQQEGSGDEDDDAGQGQWLAWGKLTPKVMAHSRAAPAMDFMLGPLSVEQKKRQLTQRAKLDKSNKEEVQPEEVRDRLQLHVALLIFCGL